MADVYNTFKHTMAHEATGCGSAARLVGSDKTTGKTVTRNARAVMLSFIVTSKIFVNVY